MSAYQRTPPHRDIQNMDILHIDPKVLILQIGAFIILLIIFKLFLFTPVLGIMEARRKEINDDYEKAEEDKNRACEMKEQYEKELAAIRTGAEEKMNDALASAEKAKNEIIEESRLEAQSMIEKAKEQISVEKDAAIRTITADVADLALAAAEKIIRSEIDGEKNKKNR